MGEEEVFKEVIGENFLELIKDMTPQLQEQHQIQAVLIKRNLSQLWQI